MVVQHARQEFSGIGLGVTSDLFGRSRSDNAAAPFAALRTEVNQPVGGLDDVEIVFDQKHGSAALDQFSKGRKQLLNIIEMQPGRGFVEDIKDARIFLASKMRGKFQPLCFSPGKRRSGLPEAQIAETDHL